MAFEKITEAESAYHSIEKMPVGAILTAINTEDRKVPEAVTAAIPQIEALVKAIADKMLAGGRLFYIGAGTSGRLGVVDASECPPTFGVPEGLVNGIIAGGNEALVAAVEFAEDNAQKGWEDLAAHGVGPNDVVVGISASGMAPYVLYALKECRNRDIITGAISCNPSTPIASAADFPVEVIVGPEFITGSTRMKAGTAQKLVLNMISTAVMVLLGRVEDNHMVHMQLTNEKLINRGVEMVMKKLNISNAAHARALLLQYGSVKEAIRQYHP